jgi:hypothetical protein
VCRYQAQIEKFKMKVQMHHGHSSCPESLSLQDAGQVSPQTILSSGVSDTSLSGLHPVEQDDDSPFYLKILCDSTFLALLEDANLTEAHEIVGPPSRFDDVIEN